MRESDPGAPPRARGDSGVAVDIPSTANAATTQARSPPAGDPLEQLLRKAWVNPDSGARIGVDIDAIAIEANLRGQEAERVAALGIGQRLAVVSDATTHAILGARIERALASVARIDSIVLPAHVHADMATVERVRIASAGADALVAVGSGTINDLAKFAAACDAKPYVVFPTAPSMNGYTSANAAITVDGHKKSLAAALARGVFIDLDVFAAAPRRLICAGLGDSLCRSTAQVDWLLSHHLLGTAYGFAPFALLARDEAVLLDAPQALVAGDRDALRALARTLVLSGIGMTLCGGSYPASQGEHLISHYVDMCAPPERPAFLHGEQVGVATLTMARLQEAMLDKPAPVLRTSAIDAPMLIAHFGEEVGAQCWQEFSDKRIDDARAGALTARVGARWEALRRDAATAGIGSTRIASVLQRAAAPLTANDIGLAEGFYAQAVRHARFLRNRYTFLDLAADTGTAVEPFLA